MALVAVAFSGSPCFSSEKTENIYLKPLNKNFTLSSPLCSLCTDSDSTFRKLKITAGSEKGQIAGSALVAEAAFVSSSSPHSNQIQNLPEYVCFSKEDANKDGSSGRAVAASFVAQGRGGKRQKLLRSCLRLKKIRRDFPLEEWYVISRCKQDGHISQIKTPFTTRFEVRPNKPDRSWSGTGEFSRASPASLLRHNPFSRSFLKRISATSSLQISLRTSLTFPLISGTLRTARSDVVISVTLRLAASR